MNRDYGLAIRRLHDAGVMVNASFVFGMDGDGPDVFKRTVDWAVAQGIETATFHILTPYPDTPLFRFMRREYRLTSLDWDRYDTRHAVFRPRRMSAGQLEAGYRQAYREFYSWTNIFKTTGLQKTLPYGIRHFAFKAAWKKFEPFWDLVVRIKSVSTFTPMLEAVLSGFMQPDLNGEETSVVATDPQVRGSLTDGPVFPASLLDGS